MSENNNAERDKLGRFVGGEFARKMGRVGGKKSKRTKTAGESETQEPSEKNFNA